MNVKILNVSDMYFIAHIYSDTLEDLDKDCVSSTTALLDCMGYDISNNLSTGNSLVFRIVEKKDTLLPKLS